MKNFIYKCVEAPSVIETGQIGNNMHSQAISNYEAIINKAAQGGWELVNIDTVSSIQKPGCLSGMFGGKAEVVTFKMLVFKKEE